MNRKTPLISVIIGSLVAIITLFVPGYDLQQMTVPAKDFLVGNAPLSNSVSANYVPYPLTVIPFGIPFSSIDFWTARAIFMGISCALLVLFLRPSYKIIAMLGLPFVLSVYYNQYAPLIVALSLFGAAPIAILIKPQGALPLLLAYHQKRWAWIIAGVVVLWSILSMGWWVPKWIEEIAPYHGMIPFLSLPGVFVPLVLLVRRDRPAWLLVLMALTPQRGIYDLLALSLVPQTRRGLVALIVTGWIAVLVTNTPDTPPAWVVSCFYYIPACLVLLAEHYSDRIQIHALPPQTSNNPQYSM